MVKSYFKEVDYHFNKLKKTEKSMMHTEVSVSEAEYELKTYSFNNSLYVVLL